MRNENRRTFYKAGYLLTAFVLWTAAVCVIDVQPVGPEGSCVGFAAINQFFHHLTGVHMALYMLTDWLGLVPVCFGAGFALLGLVQWIRRKRLWKVDPNLLALGGFYTLVMVCYVFFEIVVVNYRPILIDGILEASYPSSTTMLVLCVMPTARMQFHARIRNTIWKRCLDTVITIFMIFMVIGRLLSGVHWFSDIVGGGLLSASLVTLYHAVSTAADA